MPRLFFPETSTNYQAANAARGLHSANCRWCQVPDQNGNFYGVTVLGGACGPGVVFELTP